MEGSGLSPFQGIGNAVKKKRTHRPRPEPARDVSMLSTTPSPDDLRVGSSNDNIGGDNNSRRKVLSLSQCSSKFPGDSGPESERAVKRNKKVDIGLDELYGNSHVRDGVESGRSSGPSVDGLGAVPENKVKKVKLKLGGVTRTIGASSLKDHASADTMKSSHKINHKGVLDSDNSPHNKNRSGLKGIPWKDFSSVGISLGRERSLAAKGSGNNGSGKQGEKPDSARRNRRASKKRSTDCLDDDSDDEIRYLEKLKNARLLSGFGDDDEDSSKKHRSLSKFSGNSPQHFEEKYGKKRSPSEDTDIEEHKERISDGEPDSRKKKARREPVDSPVEPKRELTLTTRQRALHSGKDGSTNGGIEFPNGLPPAPSKKPKEVLTEVEQQLKRAEAAQRRKMQNEKAARESEAEAIRKILGQDSSRKKKEDKKKKRVADLAQEKAADELMHASSTVRLVMGPTGTTITFPNEMGFPSIFTSGPCRYPPPREKCAGPSCSNPYKYRDSKTKLPLCSLQCYKSVQGYVQSEAATC